MRQHLTDSASLPHRAGRWLALWLFALGASVTLVAGWGRSVSTDPATVQTAVEHVLASEAISSQLGEWLSNSAAAIEGVQSDAVREIVDDLWSTPEIQEVLAEAIAEVAAAAITSVDQEVRVDLTDEIDRIAPVLGPLLERHGLAGFSAESLVGRVEPFVLEGLDAGPVVNTVDNTRDITNLALLFGLGVMMIAGISALNLAEDRMGMARILASRMATSAITFGVMLQLGAWALDPTGGGAPIMRGGAAVLRSNVHVPIIAALGSLLLVSIISMVMRRRLATVPVPYAAAPIEIDRVEPRQPALID